ncbi:MAG TPA: alpha/beta fold hydrolase [Gemmatimonadales bacterium]|nr:alpha/beta fold hydrolase [Gemmatimonadales bacterium]
MVSITRLAPVMLSLLVLAACQRPPAKPAIDLAPHGYVDAGGGVRLGYRLVGAGRDTVVVVHGGPGFTMDYLVDDLAPMAQRHTLLFYDQRGTGRSSLVADSAGLDAQRFVDDLEALRAHFGLGRLTILGHSWGAAVAALYALRFPDQVGQLIIVAGVPTTKAQLIADFERLEAGRDSATSRRMREWMAARVANPADAEACRAYYTLWFRPFFADSSDLSRSQGDFCAGTPESRRNKLAGVDRFTMASLGDWDWRPALRAVTARALIVRGTADVLSGERDWAASLPNARLLVLERAGHFPYLEVPARFYPAIDTFLAGGWPDGARSASMP